MNNPTRSVFNSQGVITEEVSDATLRTYIVGFDFGQYRYDTLIDKLTSAVVDFSFGFHEGILSKYSINELRQAACMIYKIEPYDSNLHSNYLSEDDYFDKKYGNRGEFGELILHVLLRDFLGTQPLVSKIFAKSSPGVPAHGFDCVHIGESFVDEDKKSLFLGESKLKINGSRAIDELLGDIEKHFVKDFLTTPAGEFALIGNKKRNFLPLDEYTDLNTVEEYKKFVSEKDVWFKKIDELKQGESLQKLFNSVTVPLLCTYTSSLLTKHNDTETGDFKNEFKIESDKLKEKLDLGLVKLRSKHLNSGEPISTNLNIVLMLFPVPSKRDFILRMHNKLYHQQNS